MKKRYIYFFIVVVLLLILIRLFNFSEVDAFTKKEGIDSFPSSYQPYLKELAKKYPNWKFTALYTNLDWNEVIKKENVFGKNLVPKNYSKSWKNTESGKYNVEVDSGWVDSSKQAVQYCMDPRNFLNEVRIFQFEGLSYDSKTNNLECIEKILYGTEFYNKKVSYLNSSGKQINMTEKYSDLILKAGKTSKVSPYHLASRIKQEVGPFLTHKSISGDVSGYKGLYNFYNIGATSSTNQLGSIKKGLQYAKDGNGASSSLKKKYLIPWDNKEKSITGGGIFIGSSYINVGQNTIYLQKFDVNDERGNDLFWHQYMTNVLAPYSESKSIYNGYQKIGMLNTSMNFIIPVYNNMPDIHVQSPDIRSNDFTKDNTTVYCKAKNVNIRTGPTTSYETITTISKDTKMTRIAKGKQTGDKWDKVKLSNGIIGYIFQSYVTETPPVQIENIGISIDNTTLQKGEKKQLKLAITPKEASDNKVLFSSSNLKVASVDDNGNITAISSGKSTITVKAKDNDVKSEIDITVYSKVTGIIVDKSEIYISEGDTIKITAYVEPEDANDKQVLYMSSDNQIANVDQNGNIKTYKQGETIITAKSNENPDIKKDCKVYVVRQIDESEIKFDKSFTINEYNITGFRTNTVGFTKEKIDTKLDVEFINNKGNVLKDADLVGTGSKIRIKENGKILREYIVILYGDVNGDGKINPIDLLILQRHILEIKPLENIYKIAGNIRKNGKNPSPVDLLLIQRHILEIQEIEQ